MKTRDNGMVYVRADIYVERIPKKEFSLVARDRC